MMRQGHAYLLLWDVDTVVEMRNTRSYKFIQVSVITMLLGGHWAQSWWHVRPPQTTHGHVSK